MKADAANGELLQEIDDLKARLTEAEDTLRAIRAGEVDALVVTGPQGERVFSLRGSDHPYRGLVEHMAQGAATLGGDGTILYCNRQLGALLQVPLEKLVGSSFRQHVAAADRDSFQRLLRDAVLREKHAEITLVAADGTPIMVLASFDYMTIDEVPVLSLVMTDLRQQKRNEQLLRESMRFADAQQQAALNLAQDEAAARQRAERADQETGNLNKELVGRILESQQAEATIRSSKERLQDILDSMFAFVGLVSPDGILLDANSAPLKACGLRKEDVVGKPFADLAPWSFSLTVQGAIRSAVASAARGETVRFDTQLRVADQSLIDLDVSFGPLRDALGNVIQVVVSGVDISKRKQAEQKLRESQVSLTVQREAAMNLAQDEMLARQRAEGAEQELRKLNEELEQRVHDRTAELEASTHRFRTIFEEAPLGIALIDSLTGQIYEVNRRFADIAGRTREEMMFIDWMSITHPDDVQEDLDGMAALNAGKIPGFSMQKRYRRPDGSFVWIYMTIAPIPVEDPCHPRHLCMIEDISERKKVEEMVKQLNEDLRGRIAKEEAANKELEAFSYSVSHDLRSPLRAIDGFSRILLEDYASHLPEDGQRYLRLARENAQRMGQLIDDLLGFSRLGRQQMQKQLIAPTALVQAVVAELQIENAGRQVEVVLGELPPCQADAALLKQVFANLLGNAFKYTRNQPATRIEVGSYSRSQESGIRGQEAGGKLLTPDSSPLTPDTVYFVKDNGAGFDMQYAHNLFGVFQRLHRAEDYPGTGVGLAIVQRIIHRHGGRVWAEAAVNQGATFYFTLSQGVDS